MQDVWAEESAMEEIPNVSHTNARAYWYHAICNVNLSLTYI